jgi:transposase-like protein
VIPFFAFPEGARWIIYTTNAIEALNFRLRLAVMTRGHFPSDDASTKLPYLILNRTAGEWKGPPHQWTEAKQRLDFDQIPHALHLLCMQCGEIAKLKRCAAVTEKTP